MYYSNMLVCLIQFTKLEDNKQSISFIINKVYDAQF